MGNNRNNRGFPGTPTYTSWEQMKKRCRLNRPHYENVTYCERWEDFSLFLEDMGERPPGTTLDRIDRLGNYCPENCRWATPLIQNRNLPNVTMIDYNGTVKPRYQWAEEYGIPPSVLRMRLSRGWDIEKALKTPTHSEKSHPKSSPLPKQ
jgi:hypothetical protein